MSSLVVVVLGECSAEALLTPIENRIVYQARDGFDFVRGDSILTAELEHLPNWNRSSLGRQTVTVPCVLQVPECGYEEADVRLPIIDDVRHGLVFSRVDTRGLGYAVAVAVCFIMGDG
jgi:hypothetical protein